ncbi:hypothetical protein WJX77_004826 [Trebouxia sp. C0004]
MTDILGCSSILATVTLEDRRAASNVYGLGMRFSCYSVGFEVTKLLPTTHRKQHFGRQCSVRTSRSSRNRCCIS